MKASHYNFLATDPQTKHLIIYNTLYGSLTLLDAEEKQTAHLLLEGDTAKADKGGAIYELLKNQKHLVPNGTDELSIIRRRKRKGIEDSNRLDLILLPTLNCNFSCVYCYEEPRKGYLAENIERGIVRWLDKEIGKYKLLMLHWFGGEPLLALDQILRITYQARKFGQPNKTMVIPHITTNGYLLRRDTLDKLLAEEIYSYQVTIDGPASTHNKLRVLRSGRATFSQVFGNVVEMTRASPDVKVTVRINFNHQNLSNVEELLLDFPKDIRSQLRPALEPIFGGCDVSATDNIRADTIASKMTYLYDIAKTLGYDVTFSNNRLRTGRLVYCYAERRNQLIIGPDGGIFKCSVSKFTPEDRVGHITSQGELAIDSKKWRRWVDDTNLFASICEKCVFLPLCMGGCRKKRLAGRRGTTCPLVATNASYILKQVALGQFGEGVLAAASGR